MPLKFWDAVRHVTDCRNFARKAESEKSPHDILFGHLPAQIIHLRPFAYGMTYRRSGFKLETFAVRARDSLRMYHEGVGIYQILTDRNILRAKHVCAMESNFRGMGIFRSTFLSESSDNSQPEDDIILDDDETPNSSTEASSENVHESLTHIPAVPSAFGETDDNSDTLDENDNDDDET